MASPAYSLLPLGSVFAGRYRVETPILGGAMSAVYQATHLATDRRCALKVMLPELGRDPGLQERFLREARVTARVQSEHIVDVLDAGVDEASGMYFLVMELLVGEELGKRLSRLGPFVPAEVVLYLQQVASALDKTHAANIVHRDLKPENLFLTFRDDGSPRVKILDFGIAKVLREGTTGAHRTDSIGTPLYMAPEQFTGNPPTSATDVYALAMIAYTLLVGDPYWYDEAQSFGSPIAFAMQAVNGPAESAVARAGRRQLVLPPAFEAWFSRATQRDSTQRFQRASDAVSALAEVFGLGVVGRGATLPRGIGAVIVEGEQHSPQAAGSVGGNIGEKSAARVASEGGNATDAASVGPPRQSASSDWLGVVLGATLLAVAAAVVLVSPVRELLFGAGGSEPVASVNELTSGEPSAVESPASGAAASEAVANVEPAPEVALVESAATTPSASTPISAARREPPTAPSERVVSKAPAPNVTAAAPSTPASSKPRAAVLRCYEHPYSGRIKLHTPEGTPSGVQVFSCHRDAAGNLQRGAGL